MKKRIALMATLALVLEFGGVVQAKPRECDALNSVGVRLYYAGLVGVADAIFQYLNDMGCYEGGL